MVTTAIKDDSILKVSGLSYSYGAVKALDHIDMEIPRGKMVSIMGRNGVGKTTLVKNLLGILSSDEGSINLDGANIAKAQSHRRVKQGLGYVPQGRMIFPKLTIEENLKVGLEGRSDGQKSIPDEIFELFPVLKKMLKRMGGDLSGGQQQQLAIGRALAGDPSLLVLDEPTEGIQPNVIQNIGNILRRLVDERGLTVLLVEQYLDFIKEFSDNYYILNRGQVMEHGEINNLQESSVRKYLSV